MAAETPLVAACGRRVAPGEALGCDGPMHFLDVPPRLAAGVAVLQRDATTVQVGLDPRHAVLLPHAPEVVSTLAALAHPDPRTPVSAEVLARLDAAGLLALPRTPRARLLTSTRVPPGLESMLESAGVRLDPEAPTVVVASVGEPDRDVMDPLVRDGVPHLVARIVDGAVLLGPYVVPGQDACLRCLDAEISETDPTWPHLLEGHQAPHGTVPPALLGLMAHWIAAELTALAHDRTPATRGATLRLPLALEGLEITRWQPHPECGCAWDHRAGAGASLGPPDTMAS